jgi:hypothetical protein
MTMKNEIVEDGEMVRVSMTMMDADQRAVATGTKPERLHERLSPEARAAATAPRPARSGPPMRAEARTAYEASIENLSNAWRK